MAEFYDDIPPEIAMSVTPVAAHQLPGIESGMDVRSIYFAEKHRMRTGETISVEEAKRRYSEPAA